LCVFIQAEQTKLEFLKVIITLKILGVFQNNFALLFQWDLHVPKFIAIQNTLCNPLCSFGMEWPRQ